MKLNIGKHQVGNGHTFIIAEIGNNHNGDVNKAKKLIDLAIEMGADCVKFQMRHLAKVYRKSTLQKNSDDLGTEYVLDLLNRFELSLTEHKYLFDYCEIKGITYMCTPWDEDSVGVLESWGVKAYKVASADLTNIPLLTCLLKTLKPLIISTGMSSEDEIRITAGFLNQNNAQYAMLHCNSTYPAPLHDINLNWLKSLKEIHPLVGYSGHERGIGVSIAAIALGAEIIERHFTLDRNMEGPDHAASLEFDEFQQLIANIRDVEECLGETQARNISQGEMINRENLGKSLVASRTLKKGSVLTENDIKVRSPGQGISPQKYQQLLGKILDREMKEEDFFFSSDLSSKRIEARDYVFSRPWGIPVRYHDFIEYKKRIEPDLFEFHLSYSDMELDPETYLAGVYSCDFVVHAPELFSNSRLMDLASKDEAYRQNSLQETQRVIDITRKLKQFFPKTERPMIVANIGGFTMDEPMEESERQVYYEIFRQSLSELDLDGVELTPQTMAPFPWHFGGQRYQNLFVHIDEIVKWCSLLNLRMCFDISHSRLTCNHFKYDFYEFTQKIAPITAHLHLGDAQGVNGEGLQIGSGDIDFNKLSALLKQGCPSASFIPEIWQGHKNAGEGFWFALEKLEGMM